MNYKFLRGYKMFLKFKIFFLALKLKNKTHPEKMKLINI